MRCTNLDSTNKFTFFCRFFNYPGQPGLSSVPSVVPNILPPPPPQPPTASIVSHLPRQCVSNYVNFPEHQSENSPMMQLQNFGRHFESS